MNDTTPEFAALVAARFAAMTPAERVAIVLQMNETARRIVISSLPAALDGAERKRRLCERFYGRELAERAYPPP